jgi:hypothetical protein
MQVYVSIEVKVRDLEIVNFKNHFTLTYQNSMVKAKVICNVERKLVELTCLNKQYKIKYFLTYQQV